MKKTTFYCFLQNGLASRVASNGELPKWEFQGEAKLKFFLFNLESIVFFFLNHLFLLTGYTALVRKYYEDNNVYRVSVIFLFLLTDVFRSMSTYRFL